MSPITIPHPIMMTHGYHPDHSLQYPNKLGRIVLLALEETIGRGAVDSVLESADLAHLIGNYPPDNFDLAVPPSDLAAILQSIETQFGTRGGPGVALRAGRSCFKYGLHALGPLLGISDLTFRLLPLNSKIRIGAEACASTLNGLGDSVVRWEEKPDYFWWDIERCPICWGRNTSSPCCHLLVGLIQESLYWVSGGKHFLVEEESCIAGGAEMCRIRVARQPLDG